MGPMAVAIQGIITTPAVPLRRTRLPFAPTTTTATFLQLPYAPTRDQPGVDGDRPLDQPSRFAGGQAGLSGEVVECDLPLIEDPGHDGAGRRDPFRKRER